MVKKKKKKDKSTACILKDWEGKEILLPGSVLNKHLDKAAHDESYEYYETLKENISNPESVVRSSYRKDTKIANIKLINRKHKYLQVVIRYKKRLIDRIKGNGENLIVTFYPTDSPKEGKKVWPED